MVSPANRPLFASFIKVLKYATPASLSNGKFSPFIFLLPWKLLHQLCASDQFANSFFPFMVLWKPLSPSTCSFKLEAFVCLNIGTVCSRVTCKYFNTSFKISSSEAYLCLTMKASILSKEDGKFSATLLNSILKGSLFASSRISFNL